MIKLQALRETTLGKGLCPNRVRFLTMCGIGMYATRRRYEVSKYSRHRTENEWNLTLWVRVGRVIFGYCCISQV